MRYICLLALFVGCGALLPQNSIAAEKKLDLVSGIPVGEPIDTFDVLAATGPAKGKTLCYACQFGGKPVIAVFFKEIDENVGKLLSEVDETVQNFENKKLRAFGIYLTDNSEAAQSELEQLAATHKIKSLPLTIFKSQDGPPTYEIKQQAAVNVMMWSRARVKANHSFRSAGELTLEQRQAILTDTEKILAR